MSIKIREERRKNPKARLTEYCLTSFDHAGKDFYAIMTNLSHEGAQFTMNTVNENIHMVLGEELEFNIKTPYGNSTSSGVIKWIHMGTDQYKWGIEFTQVPSGEYDPIRCLMESAL